MLATLSLSAWAQVRKPEIIRVDPAASRRVTAPGFIVDPGIEHGLNRTFIELSRYGKLICGAIDGRYVREDDIDPVTSRFYVSSVGLCVDREGVTRYVNPRLSAHEIRELEMELQQVADADEAARQRRNDDDRSWDEHPESDSIRFSPYRGASQE